MRFLNMRVGVSGLALLLLLSACVYPGSTVEQGSEQASLFFGSMPEGAQVYVDGEPAGFASDYDGVEKVLAVAEGRHVVEVRSNGSVIVRKDLFVGQGSRIKITAE